MANATSLNYVIETGDEASTNNNSPSLPFIIMFQLKSLLTALWTVICHY